MKQKTVFSQLCGLSVEERIKFVGSSSLGIRRLDELSILQAAKWDELCPAALSEKVLGAAASCEALNRTSGGCRACTERFLRMPWPERAPDRAFMD